MSTKTRTWSNTKSKTYFSFANLRERGGTQFYDYQRTIGLGNFIASFQRCRETRRYSAWRCPHQNLTFVQSKPGTLFLGEQFSVQIFTKAPVRPISFVKLFCFYLKYLYPYKISSQSPVNLECNVFLVAAVAAKNIFVSFIFRQTLLF